MLNSELPDDTGFSSPDEPDVTDRHSSKEDDAALSQLGTDGCPNMGYY